MRPARCPAAATAGALQMGWGRPGGEDEGGRDQRLGTGHGQRRRAGVHLGAEAAVGGDLAGEKGNGDRDSAMRI